MEIVGWTSLYIPYLDETYSAEELTYMFETKYNIGKVKRIDMVRSIKTRVKTAFIHFETWYWNDFTQFLRRELELRGKYSFNSYSTYLQNKIEHNSDCKTCVNLYQHKLAVYANEIDDITLLIHRTKYTHTHKLHSEKPQVNDQSTETIGIFESNNGLNGHQNGLHGHQNGLNSPKKNKVNATFMEGDKVEANYRGCGTWFLGKITRDRRDNTYDIAYADGGAELRVSEDNIRVILDNEMLQSSELRNIVERHEKRIELLEDEIQVLVNHYTKTQR
jgi:hypothetical protein